MTSFAVCTPSRGLVHSRTVEAVMGNVAEAMANGHDFRGWHLSHDKPIPDCHNAVAEAAFASGAEALWFVEEDTIPPAGSFLRLFGLLSDCTIAALDYPVWTADDQHWSCVCRDGTGAIRYCGLGCTLVRRELLEQVPRPWFRSDMQFQIIRQGDTTVLRETPVKYEYGGQDIYFCYAALQAGFTILELEGTPAGHARVKVLGQPRTNQGAHTIETTNRIDNWQRI